MLLSGDTLSVGILLVLLVLSPEGSDITASYRAFNCTYFWAAFRPFALVCKCAGKGFPGKK